MRQPPEGHARSGARSARRDSTSRCPSAPAAARGSATRSVEREPFLYAPHLYRSRLAPDGGTLAVRDHARPYLGGAVVGGGDGGGHLEHVLQHLLLRLPDVRVAEDALVRRHRP